MTERSNIAARTARADAFAERLLARARSRIGEALPVEMALRRTGPILIRATAARPITVSHHHTALAVHVALALAGAARERARLMERSVAPAPASPGVLRRAESSARTVVVPALSTVLVRASRAGHPAAIRHIGAPSSTVATTVRRDESVRVETVVRRGQAEGRADARRSVSAASVSSASATSMSSVAPSPGTAPFGAAARSWSSPAPGQPVALADVDIGRLTDRVVQRIQRRVNAQRERMGG